MSDLRIKDIRPRPDGGPGHVVIFERHERMKTRDGRFIFTDRVWLRWDKLGRPVVCVQVGNAIVHVDDYTRKMLWLEMWPPHDEPTPPWAMTPSGREVWMRVCKETEELFKVKKAVPQGEPKANPRKRRKRGGDEA